MWLMHQNFSPDSESKEVSYSTPICVLPVFLDVCHRRFSDFIGFIHAKKEIFLGLQRVFLFVTLTCELVIDNYAIFSGISHEILLCNKEKDMCPFC